MKLRYRFRLYPTPGQQASLAQAFGCARVVFNDAIAARRNAYMAGEKFPSVVELSRSLITEAKRTSERAWLGEVSTVVLQQALRDVDRAYRGFFDSISGKRKGRKLGAPKFRSRRDRRQSIRFTANAKFSITRGGKLRLPKIGYVPIKLSRPLPSVPSSVTVIKEASGRYFASFVVEVAPESNDVGESAIGIDLGLGHFAVLSDGTKIEAPRFLRKAEDQLKRVQRDLTRKEKGSANREKARIKLARAHARVADARRDFHHQLSAQLIGENQAIAVEDLSVSGLARTRLAKSVLDRSEGLLRRGDWTVVGRGVPVRPLPLRLGDLRAAGVGAGRDHRSPVRAD
ncbi:RNA-guided endonuclease InsQ/TnpB family protein [Saccharopolyspora flava]|uniref:RNA-guided endonuclease InsQ/TnpB family protein n=1 Tax=Saccharopolyspora flava TaxID=95161 RepID=UPI001FE474DC|nr:transposase [Saccharopolyspora flava]